jgi:hypothetical protein
MEQDSNLSEGKSLIDNSLHITELIICEFPICLNFNYCKHFMDSIAERIELLYPQAHALDQINSKNISIQSIDEIEINL